MKFPWLTRERLVVAGLLLFTAVVRGGVLWGMRGNLDQDPDLYREIAENILEHGVYGLGHDGMPLPTAYRPPLYPIVLSNLPAAEGKHVALWKVAVLHVLLGVGTVWLTYLTAKRMFASCGREQANDAREQGSDAREQASGGREPPEAARGTPSDEAPGTPQRAFPTAPLLASLLVACDPILLNQQTLVMTETLATFLSVLSLWCLARYSAHRYWWNAALAGGAIGLAALCRPTFLPWLGLVGLAMLISDFGFRISDWGRWARTALPSFVALAVAAAAAMSPWAIRNQRQFGRPILTTTHGGYTLWLGNNPSFYHWLANDRSGLPWDVQNYRAPSEIQFPIDLLFLEERLNRLMLPVYLSDGVIEAQHSEFMNDPLFQQAASEAIQNDRGMFVRACLYRIRQLWSPLPHKLTAEESTGRMVLRYGTAAWYCGVYLLAMIGVWRLRWRLLRQPWVWGVLLCLTFTAVHTLYWCNLRMRAPLMPFVALVAAAGVLPINKRAV
jgi:4-amino-4-deoxy-L-arabinose transferase-like glycosyltransferase